MRRCFWRRPVECSQTPTHWAGAVGPVGVNQALEDAVALATLVGASTSPAGVPRALAAYEELRRGRTARVQLGSRRQGAGYDSYGSQLIDRRWIYEYDAWAEAVVLT
jgi:2-polyprenyl-6-methoxyphenol hydroxylase-like FAD-dependent oxidoreductase